MAFDDSFHVIHATITDFHVAFIEDFMQLMVVHGMCFFTICMNIFPTFVLTFLLKGGLNQMIFLLLSAFGTSSLLG